MHFWKWNCALSESSKTKMRCNELIKFVPSAMCIGNNRHRERGRTREEEISFVRRDVWRINTNSYPYDADDRAEETKIIGTDKRTDVEVTYNNLIRIMFAHSCVYRISGMKNFHSFVIFIESKWEWSSSSNINIIPNEHCTTAHPHTLQHDIWHGMAWHGRREMLSNDSHIIHIQTE